AFLTVTTCRSIPPRGLLKFDVFFLPARGFSFNGPSECGWCDVNCSYATLQPRLRLVGPRRGPRHYFYRGLDALGIRYQRITVPYEFSSLRALYLPAPKGADKRPLIVIVGGFDSSLEELYLVLGKAAGDRGYSVL